MTVPHGEQHQGLLSSKYPKGTREQLGKATPSRILNPCSILEVILALSHKGVAISYFHCNPCDVTVVVKPGVVFFSLLSDSVVPVPENCVSKLTLRTIGFSFNMMSEIYVPVW